MIRSYQTLKKTQTHYLEIVSSQADRVIPVLLSVPNRKSVAPTILFSHGIGDSREAASYLRETGQPGITSQFFFNIREVIVLCG